MAAVLNHSEVRKCLLLYPCPRDLSYRTRRCLLVQVSLSCQLGAYPTNLRIAFPVASAIESTDLLMKCMTFRYVDLLSGFFFTIVASEVSHHHNQHCTTSVTPTALGLMRVTAGQQRNFDVRRNHAHRISVGRDTPMPWPSPYSSSSPDDSRSLLSWIACSAFERLSTFSLVFDLPVSFSDGLLLLLSQLSGW